MSENMRVAAEIWPLVADRNGIWLVSADGHPWEPSVPVPADSEVYAEVMLELAKNGLRPDDLSLVHSTSWRQDRGRLVVTYVVAIKLTGPDSYVHDTWPDAALVGLELFQRVGAPPTHGAIGNPAPRLVDVLYHGLRHLRFLMVNDVTVTRALGSQWIEHLTGLAPALATMYHNLHEDETGGGAQRAA